MKLQIAYEHTNLSDALAIAKETATFADVLEVGILLIYKEGIKAVEAFKKEFPDKEILADAKICDRAKEATALFTKAGADIITVLAGTSNQIIHQATTIAGDAGVKIALDLADAYSMGQSAMDAQQLGVDTILFHRPHDGTPLTEILEQWDSTRGNTKLPIFISGKITRSNIAQITGLKPQGIVVGSAIVEADNPAAEAQYFKSITNS